MNDLGITPADREVAVVARQKAEETGGPALALNCQLGKLLLVRTQSSLAYSRCLD